MEMARRQISEEDVDAVLKKPEQRFQVRPGRDVLQSVLQTGGDAYLMRVFVDIDRSPIEVVTAYRASKIGKYRRSQK